MSDLAKFKKYAPEVGPMLVLHMLVFRILFPRVFVFLPNNVSLFQSPEFLVGFDEHLVTDHAEHRNWYQKM
jgi:hypothetical protein